MEQQRLGATGLEVSRACLGTMTFGLQADQAGAFEILDHAADAGVNFIDTADSYPIGGNRTPAERTETIVGRWLQGRRDRFVVATKCGMRMGERPWDAGLSRKHILDAVEASLRRLGTDYIDLYQLHHPDPGTPMDESLRALDDLVHAGKVRYTGVSNHPAWWVARALGRSETLGLARFDCVQPRYNLLFREMEREMFPMCAAEGLGVMVYNPLAGGLLTGKHDPVVPPQAGTRFSSEVGGAHYRERYWHEREFATVAALRSVAERARLSLVQLSLAWVLSNPLVTAPIIGASRAAQFDDLLPAFALCLPPELKDELDTLTASYRHGDAPR